MPFCTMVITQLFVCLFLLSSCCCSASPSKYNLSSYLSAIESSQTHVALHGNGTDDDYLTEADYDPVPRGYLVHTVKNWEFAAWRKAQGPDAILIARGPILVLHRTRRQAPQKYEHRVITPVFKINGSKKYNESECYKWEEVAVLLRSGITPDEKSDLIEPRTCDMRQGLECLTIEDQASGEITQRCACNLVYGPEAIYTNYTRHNREYRHCFIPAELGWASECQKKPWWNFGYPLPFGDPAGTNAEKAAHVDAYNSKTGEQIIVEYIFWNSVKPTCILNAACRERGTYIGQRCQCIKKYRRRSNTPRGFCATAPNLSHQDIYAIILTIMTTWLLL